jgi:hypothetical protein
VHYWLSLVLGFNFFRCPCCCTALIATAAALLLCAQASSCLRFIQTTHNRQTSRQLDAGITSQSPCSSLHSFHKTSDHVLYLLQWLAALCIADQQASLMRE